MADVGGEGERNAVNPWFGFVVTAEIPFHFVGADAMLMLQHPTLPDGCRLLVFHGADFLASKVGGAGDAGVGVDEHIAVAEPAGREDGDGHQALVAFISEMGEGGHGEFGDIELGVSSLAAEKLAGTHGQEIEFDAFGYDGAKQQGYSPVVEAAGESQA